MDTVLLSALNAAMGCTTLYFWRKYQQKRDDLHNYQKSDILSPSQLFDRAQRANPAGDYKELVFLTGILKSELPYISKLNKAPLILSNHYTKSIYSNDDSYFITYEQSKKVKKLDKKDCVSNQASRIEVEDLDVHIKLYFQGIQKRKVQVGRNFHVKTPESLDQLAQVERKDEIGIFKKFLVVIGRVVNFLFVVMNSRNSSKSYYRGIKIGEKEIEYGIGVNAIMIVFGDAIVDTNRQSLSIPNPLYIVKDKDSILSEVRDEKNQNLLFAILFGSITIGVTYFWYRNVVNKYKQHQLHKARLANDHLDGDKVIMDGIECIICVGRKRNIIPRPCKHVCMCKECFEILPEKVCPMCKAEIIETTELYIA